MTQVQLRVHVTGLISVYAKKLQHELTSEIDHIFDELKVDHSLGFAMCFLKCLFKQLLHSTKYRVCLSFNINNSMANLSNFFDAKKTNFL